MVCLSTFHKSLLTTNQLYGAYKFHSYKLTLVFNTYLSIKLKFRDEWEAEITWPMKVK